MGMAIEDPSSQEELALKTLGTTCVVLMLCIVELAAAADWSRFRGPNGSGVADDAQPPVTWSETENLKWKTPLPGPGSSSPIVVGDKVFVTCYSGYGLDKENPGNIADLRRHLVCLDINSGEVLWDKSVPGTPEEEPYSGMLTEHGYASNTPVSDGEQVYVFFSKSGAYAYDLDGNEKWHAPIGTSSGPQHWGSGTSPILCGDLVIVNASDEANALVALNKTTGEEVWREEAAGVSGNWSTPILAESDGQQELLFGAAGEVWGMNPETHKLRWLVTTGGGGTKTSSLVTEGDLVFSLGNREDGTVAIRTGGKGDVTETNVVWPSNLRGGIGSPLVHDGYLYSFSRGIANCVSTTDGKEVYQERYTEAAGGGGGGGGRGRGPGGADYSSPVLADGKIYLTTRKGNVLVFKAGPEFELLATNSFDSDGSDFSGTPAIAGDKLLMRSNRFLYCVGN